MLPRPEVRSFWLQTQTGSLQSEATREDPIFRVSAESAEMGKHALQTWLDRHGPNFRRA